MRLLALGVAATALAGCGGTQQLLRARMRPSPTPRTTASTPRTTGTTLPPTTTTAPAPSAASVYLAQLGAEQTDLANAEQKIPTNPRTPAALARSVNLLAVAVRRLADGLAAIKPPAGVAGDHVRLVTIMRTYATRLDRAAAVAVAPNGEARAGTLLISATDRASRSFTMTTKKIDSRLGRSPS